MSKTKVAIIGYGNIGKYTLQAIEASGDMECVGIVRRNGAENKPAELAGYNVVKNIKELSGVQVAILATPTRKVEEYAKECLALGINTVDSFDIHTQIVDLRRSLDTVAKANNELGTQGSVVHQLRPWTLNGTLCGCESHRRRERRTLCNHSARNGYPSPHGVCGA